jgi:hypothetical protein
MTTVTNTDERTTVVSELPDDRAIRDSKRRWVEPSEVHIRYVATRTDSEPATTSVSVEVFGALANVKTSEGKRPSRPLITYTDETSFPDWVADYVDKNRPTDWPTQTEPTF